MGVYKQEKNTRVSTQLSAISLSATRTLREQLFNKRGKHWFNLS
ncbi:MULTISPECIES: hypothetical protein [unclassified Moorena]|nr:MULTISPECIES: hypothetical protein [unclassified Moorena]